MPNFQFHISGLTKSELGRWRRLHRRGRRPATTLTLLAAAVGAVYAIKQNLSPVIAVSQVTQTVPPRRVVQTVPPSGSTGVAVCAPFVFFLDQKYGEDPLFSLEATNPLGIKSDMADRARLKVLHSHQGNSIVIIAPTRAYPANTKITATIVQKDALGNILTAPSEFITGNRPSREVEEWGSFEWGEYFTGQGDFDFVTEKGDIRSRDGKTIALFSTGRVLGKSALAGTTSLISSNPIRLPSNNLQLEFDYNFVSSEFDQYVGTRYDDAFLMVLSGPRGMTAHMVTSVNQVGKENSVAMSFPGMPEANELPPQHTDWRKFAIDADVGRPACLTFVVTDVGDSRFTSVVALGTLRVK